MERLKRDYDANVNMKSFKPMDFVYYYYPRRYQGRSSKWSKFYTGPYRVEKGLNDVNYVIRKTPRSKPLVVHADKLQLYYGTTPVCWNGSDVMASDKHTPESNARLVRCENPSVNLETRSREAHHVEDARPIFNY